MISGAPIQAVMGGTIVSKAVAAVSGVVAASSSTSVADPSGLQWWEGTLDIVGALLIFLGAVFTLIAAVGVVRLPDLFSRMHAAAKPQMLGLMLMCGGIITMKRTWVWFGLCVLIAVIQVIAAPVGSHMLGRAAYRDGMARTAMLVVDELEEDPKGGGPQRSSSSQVAE